MKLIVSLLVGSLVAAFPTGVSAALDASKFRDVMRKMEGDTLELARYTELLHQERCTSNVMAMCKVGNYFDCNSNFPTPTCHGGDNLGIGVCGDIKTTCNAMYDFNVSSVSLPNSTTTFVDGKPQDKDVIDHICYTQKLDAWFKDKRAKDAAYWKQFNDEPSGWLIGTTSGVFRILPARSATSCGRFDPRVRPWYAAAATGPKNVLLLVEVTLDEKRWPKIKDAVLRVISSLSPTDKVNVVTFDAGASVVNASMATMVPATADNKAHLIAAVNAVKLGIGHNYLAGFTAAFDVMDATVAASLQACKDSTMSNTALVYITNSVTIDSTVPVKTLVQSRMANLAAQKMNVALFAYSINWDVNSPIHKLSSELACLTKGVATKITNNNLIAETVASYVEDMAVGLASTNHTAWAIPYNFDTADTFGTTVSAPVFDRTVTPPKFLGVVGIDFGLQALAAALGGTTAESLSLVTAEANNNCPAIALPDCTALGKVYDGFCNSSATYPTDVFHNANFGGKTYEERACCAKTAEPVAPGTCPRAFAMPPVTVSAPVVSTPVAMPSTAAPMAAVVAPVQATPTGAPKAAVVAPTPVAPAPAPVKAPTTATVTRKRCGLLRMSVLCFNGCGLLGRILGLCKK